jgi:hypothetical protein
MKNKPKRAKKSESGKFQTSYYCSGCKITQNIPWLAPLRADLTEC